MVSVRAVVVAPETRLVVPPDILYQKLLAIGKPVLAVKVNVTLLPALVVTLEGEMPLMVGAVGVPPPPPVGAKTRPRKAVKVAAVAFVMATAPVPVSCTLTKTVVAVA